MFLQIYYIYVNFPPKSIFLHGGIVIYRWSCWILQIFNFIHLRELRDCLRFGSWDVLKIPLHITFNPHLGIWGCCKLHIMIWNILKINLFQEVRFFQNVGWQGTHIEWMNVIEYLILNCKCITATWLIDWVSHFPMFYTFWATIGGEFRFKLWF